MDRNEMIEMLDRYNLKSHDVEEVVEALLEGLPVFDVDTASSGNDDVIICAMDEDEEDVKALFVAHFELEGWPDNWTVTPLVLDDRYRRKE